MLRLLDRSIPPHARSAAMFGALAFCLAIPNTGHAQMGGKGFLLGAPEGSLNLRVGYDHANAGSDIFNDQATIGQLSLRKRDFSSPSIAAEIATRVSDRFDVLIGGGYSGARARSDYRDFIDNNDAPIEQATSFTRVPIMFGARAYLAPRGRSIGRFAWVPSRVAPYVGGGLGTMYYKFRQHGDFIDFNSSNMRVFSATFESSHWATLGYAMAGMDYSVSPGLALTTEARYTTARGQVSSDYSGFDRIDLSGVNFTAGVAVRF